MTGITACAAQSKQICRSSLITVTDPCDRQQDNQDKAIGTYFSFYFYGVFCGEGEGGGGGRSGRVWVWVCQTIKY